MFDKLKCKLDFHDWEVLERPTYAGFCSEARCRCRRCGRATTLVSVFSDHLYRRWEEQAG